MMPRMPEARLLSERRVAMLESMRARPGQTLRGLAKATSQGAGTTQHHVGILQRHGLAWSIGHGFRRRCFAGERPTEDAAAYMARLAGLDEAMAAVLSYVRAHPGCAQKDILAAFPEKPHSTTQRILGRLERERFLARAFCGRFARHTALEAPAVWAGLVPAGIAAKANDRPFQAITTDRVEVRA